MNCDQVALLPRGFLESNTALPASDCSLEADENSLVFVNDWIKVLGVEPDEEAAVDVLVGGQHT